MSDESTDPTVRRDGGVLDVRVEGPPTVIHDPERFGPVPRYFDSNLRTNVPKPHTILPTT